MEKKTVVDRRTIIHSLSKLSELSDELVTLLDIPSKLFDVSKEGKYSYSSSEGVSGSELSGCFFLKLPLPKNIPDYAIDISLNGHTLFCTFIDRRRKLIAGAPLKTVLDGNGDWGRLEYCIKAGMKEAAKLDSARKRFQFILADEDETRVL